MRIPTKSQFILQGLALIMISLATNVMASDNFNKQTGNANNQKHWVCDYTRAQNDVLYLRCDDMASLLNDPLIMEEEYQDNSTKFIPIWRRPDNESSAVKLVEAVLCNQNIQCSVQLKSLFSSGRFVNR